MEEINSLEIKPDPILWSEKLYSKTSDYFDNLTTTDKNIPISRFNHHILNHISDLFDTKVICYSYAVNGKFNLENAMVELIRENSGEVDKILNCRFDLATICTFPISRHEDKIVLCLAGRDNN